VALFVRKVPTAVGARAVQVVHKQGRQVVGIEHIGSAHDDAQLAVLMEIARQQLHPGQDELDLGSGASGGAARITSTRSQVLWEVLSGAYARLGFDVLGGAGFRAMVLARLVERTSKADTVRVLAEIGAPCPSPSTLFRALTRAQARDYRGQLATACRPYSARTTGAASLVLYDVATLRFENGQEDDLRRVGMSKEHRVAPQVQVGLLVDPGGFPLEVHPFEADKGRDHHPDPCPDRFPGPARDHGHGRGRLMPGCSRRRT
jgi:hypothetical protein